MSPSRFLLRRRRDTELAQEIQTHIAEETAENLARGLSPQEARRQAYLKFGNPEIIREHLWQQNTFPFFDSIWRDLKYAARSLRRAPGFSLMAILVMALGIGGTVAMFTVVRTVLLNPLPYAESQRLYSLYERDTKPQFGRFLPVAAGSFNQWKQAAEGAAEMALISPWQGYSVSSEGGRLPENIDGGWCSWNFFNLLRVQPALGRTFTPADDAPDAPATVILAHAFWARRYGSDPNIIGKSIYLDAKPYTVIGVLPESFWYASAMSGNTTQVWTPASHEAWPGLMQQYDDHEFLAVARLLPGVTLPELMGRLNTVQKRIQQTQTSPAIHDGVNGHSMLDDAVAEYRTPLYTLLAATGCVLLIACLNVGSLLVARIAAKSKEHAIRAALGGSRWRLLRERLTESLLLSVSGGALGLWLAWFALRWLVNARHDMHRVELVRIDLASVAFTVGAVLFAAAFSAILSSVGSGRTGLLATLQESSRSHTGGAARATLRRVLLVGEVGVTVVLLIGAGLLLKSYERLRSTDLGVGIPLENALTLSISLPQARYTKDEKSAAFFEQLITRVRTLPGVESASLVNRAPGQGWGGDGLMEVREHPPLPKGVGLDLLRRAADPQYFSTLQIPLLKGRTFNENERLERGHVAVLSASGAKLLFPDEDPIGKHIKSGMFDYWFEVVGVVGDTRWSINEPLMPAWYMPIYGNMNSFATVVVRSSHNVESLAMPVQKIIGKLDPDLPVAGVRTLHETINRSTLSSHFNSLLVLAFAIIALILAAAGLYGVLAYLVTQRTGEIGVRMALGARREQVLALILADGLRPALFGLLLGLAISAGAVRLIASMLYQTKPYDIPVFCAVAFTLIAMAAVACLLPAWRASRLDPVQALRTE